MTEPDYSKLSDDEFMRILEDILDSMKTSELLAIPGILEILKEELNNTVLEWWELEQGNE